ncbi:unnamed protein product, partial [marine sediment metagenome]
VGDQQAYRYLFGRYRQQAYRLAYHFLGRTDDAADAVQDSFIKAFKALERFEGRAKFSTWLMRIVTNTCLDRMRSKAADATVPLSDEMARMMSESSQPMRRAGRPEEAMEYGELSAALAGALQKLSSEHRTVFVLHADQELTYREIAEMLGISEGTVMSRLYHARKNLQRLLAGAGVLPDVRRRGDKSHGGSDED